MDNDLEQALSSVTTLESWVMTHVDKWDDYYTNNHQEKFEEYYRIWRGIWAQTDKTRDSERSRIVTPATQQAVESSVAEVEEATFGRGHWFDMRDDLDDPEKEDIILYRKKLEQAFHDNKIRTSVAEVLINAAVFGTGIAEVVVEETEDRVVATQSALDGAAVAVGVNVMDKVKVKLRPVLPQNFRIDPVATCIDESVGVAIDEFVSVHTVETEQRNGVYRDVAVHATTYDLDQEPNPNLEHQSEDKVRLIKWFGEVPQYLLEIANLGDDADSDDIEKIREEDDGTFVEALVVIANDGILLKAEENPYMMQDRPVIAFQWDIIPGLFWGRGVVEKAYNSQKALDAEIRARIDALALTVHPMMGVDSSKFVRGTDTSIRPGKTVFTNGDPNTVLRPFNFGNVDQITFAQASELQKMVRQATGAIESVADLGGQARTDGGISASLAPAIKRFKRTLLQFQDNFLIPFVKQAAWRYMQFDPENYPAKDYRFSVTSTLGMMAREYEVAQLTQLLQTMSPDSPAYPVLIEAIINNTSVENRESLIQTLREAQQPSEEEIAAQQAAQKAQIDFQQSQTNALNGQAAETEARARKLEEESKYVQDNVLNDRIKALASMDSEDDKAFNRRLEAAKVALKEKELGTKQGEVMLRQVGNNNGSR